MVKISERIKVKPFITVTIIAGILSMLTNLLVLFLARNLFSASLELQGPDMLHPERLPLLQMLPEGLVISVVFSLLLAGLCKLTKYYFLITAIFAAAIASVTILGPVAHSIDLQTKIALGITHLVLVSWPIALHMKFSLKK